MSIHSDTLTDRSQLSGKKAKRLHTAWPWVLTSGILALICGLVAISAPVFTGIGFTILLGSLLLAAGAFQTVQALKNRHDAGFGAHLFTAILATIAGLVLLFNPISGLMTLGIFLTAYLFVSGLFRVFYSMQLRPVEGWGWMLTGGLITTLLASILWMQLPVSGLMLPGIFVGIDLAVLGSIQILLAVRLRSYDQSRT